MSKTKLHLLTEVGCLLCDTLYDSKRADAGFTTCFECGVMLSKFARTERARFYDLNPDRRLREPERRLREPERKVIDSITNCGE